MKQIDSECVSGRVGSHITADVRSGSDLAYTVNFGLLPHIKLIVIFAKVSVKSFA